MRTDTSIGDSHSEGPDCDRSSPRNPKATDYCLEFGASSRKNFCTFVPGFCQYSCGFPCIPITFYFTIRVHIGDGLTLFLNHSLDYIEINQLWGVGI